MKIGVIGSSGQVAQALADCAAGTAIELRTFGRPDFDLLAPEKLRDAIRLFQPDILVNAAAYTAVDRAEAEPELADAVNAVGAGLVADISKVCEIPVIHISTDYVFDGHLDRPYRETDPVSPQSVYGLSKLKGEELVARANPNHVILRTSWVYSPFGGNFLKTMLRLGETRDQVSVVSDQIGQPTYALDIASAILRISVALAAEPRSGDWWGVFHLAGSHAASWADFARFIFAEAMQHGRNRVEVQDISTQDYNAPARRPANSRLDTSKLAQIYGITLPDWRVSSSACITRLLAKPNNL